MIDINNLRVLLKIICSQLEMGKLLGYGTKKSYESLHEQLEEIEEKASGGNENWLNKIIQ
jgi:hypothetical protein